jgi:hypothetical protein
LTKSLNTNTDWVTITVTVTERSSGKMTLKKTRIGPAPAMVAASSSSRGIVAMNARKSRMQNDIPKATSMRIRPGSVSKRLSFWSTQTVGTTAGGMISPLRTTSSTTRVELADADVASHGREAAGEDRDRADRPQRIRTTSLTDGA